MKAVHTMAKTILNTEVLRIATQLETINDSLRIIDSMQAEGLCDWDINDAPGKTSVLIERQIFMGAAAGRYIREVDDLVKELYQTQSDKH
jgi:hypothetical protein